MRFSPPFRRKPESRDYATGFVFSFYRLYGPSGRVLREDDTSWPPAVAAIRILLLTGCRRDEVLSLRWDDVDRAAEELRLRDTKTGPRMVPLAGPLLASRADRTRAAQRPLCTPRLLRPGFQIAGSPRASAGYDYGVKLRIAPAGLSPASTAARLAATLPPDFHRLHWH